MGQWRIQGSAKKVENIMTLTPIEKAVKILLNLL